MSELHTVVLFTNGNMMAIGEDGTTHDIQYDLSSKYNSNKINAIEEIIKKRPIIKIAKWETWVHEITIEEFCLLINVYDIYKRIMKELKGD